MPVCEARRNRNVLKVHEDCDRRATTWPWASPQTGTAVVFQQTLSLFFRSSDTHPICHREAHFLRPGDPVFANEQIAILSRCC